MAKQRLFIIPDGRVIPVNSSNSTGGERAPGARGICIALLGSDGSGKSTLLARLQTDLQPGFPTRLLIHFRPGIFGKKSTGAVTDPHGKPPRNIFLSWLKVGYYFADHLLGWFFVVRPVIKRGGLVIFDRNFDDLLVDERRYRLQGTNGLTRCLRGMVPTGERIFVLCAPAQVLHQRKPELPLAELERQQAVLRRLAESGGRYRLVDATKSADEVAGIVRAEIDALLSARGESRNQT